VWHAMLSCMSCRPTRCPSLLPNPPPSLRPPAAAAANSGRFMGPVGLFAYSRHPNYFVSPRLLPSLPCRCCSGGMRGAAAACRHWWMQLVPRSRSCCVTSRESPQNTHTPDLLCIPLSLVAGRDVCMGWPLCDGRTRCLAALPLGRRLPSLHLCSYPLHVRWVAAA
jgi:hypothetical protein